MILESIKEKISKRPIYYILDDLNNPVPVNDPAEWATWREKNSEVWVISQDHLGEDLYVSTVFLGIDHNYLGVGDPLLYETMIFGGKNDQWQERTSTYDEAVTVHKIAMNIALGEME